MEKITMCAVCGLVIAKYSCRACGRSVCEGCYDKEKGICISCRQGRS